MTVDTCTSRISSHWRFFRLHFERIVHLLKATLCVHTQQARKQWDEQACKDFLLDKTHTVRLQWLDREDVLTIEQPWYPQSSQPAQFPVRISLEHGGRNVMPFAPAGCMYTSSRAPFFASPSARLMNGFQSGKVEKSVRSCHTRSADASISISARISFLNIL